MKKIISISLLLMFPLVCFAQDASNVSEEKRRNEQQIHKILLKNTIEPPADGIFSTKGVTIKFVPPKGWKMHGQIRIDPANDAHIDFLHPDFAKTNLSIYIFSNSGIIPDKDKKVLSNILRSKTSGNPDALEGSLIKFATTDAATWITKSSGITTKVIYFFVNRDVGCVIQFEAYERDFEKLIPDVEGSLKSFEIISPLSK